MKLRALAAALALSFAVAQVAAPAAYAETNAFRSVEAQTFSQAELQRYGLSADDASQVAAYQDAGYQVQVVSASDSGADDEPAWQLRQRFHGATLPRKARVL
jgi:hypothetical protein